MARKAKRAITSKIGAAGRNEGEEPGDVNSLEWNMSVWDKDYAWSEDGDEWSKPWGGAELQWKHCIRPRIGQWLPTGSILEIAPGHGRWAAYLSAECERYVGVDYSETCVDFCRKRFAGNPGVQFFSNDGKTLDMVPDASVDFVFSFDSLVHVDWSVLTGYIDECLRVMKSGAAAMLHHSNAKCAPENYHFRANDVSAKEIAEYIQSRHACDIRQEIVDWNHNLRTDCLTAFTKTDAASSRTQCKVNNNFMLQAAVTRLFRSK
jgi:SAM-dependent methyltransferase